MILVHSAARARSAVTTLVHSGTWNIAVMTLVRSATQNHNTAITLVHRAAGARSAAMTLVRNGAKTHNAVMTIVRSATWTHNAAMTLAHCAAGARGAVMTLVHSGAWTRIAVMTLVRSAASWAALNHLPLMQTSISWPSRLSPRGQRNVPTNRRQELVLVRVRNRDCSGIQCTTSCGGGFVARVHCPPAVKGLVREVHARREAAAEGARPQDQVVPKADRMQPAEGSHGRLGLPQAAREANPRWLDGATRGRPHYGT
jgi:hypothetical protein